MPERYSNLQPDQYALQSWLKRDGEARRRPMGSLPEITVVVGMDAVSSGATIHVWHPTGGVNPTLETLYAVRWGAPIHSAEEALRLCAKAVTHALAELFPDQRPE